MTDIFEEWFKRIEIRLKYELDPAMYEKVLNIMLTELRTLHNEEKLKQERETERLRKRFSQD
jgi:hypothetical protein